MTAALSRQFEQDLKAIRAKTPRALRKLSSTAKSRRGAKRSPAKEQTARGSKRRRKVKDVIACKNNKTPVCQDETKGQTNDGPLSQALDGSRPEPEAETSSPDALPPPSTKAQKAERRRMRQIQLKEWKARVERERREERRNRRLYGDTPTAKKQAVVTFSTDVHFYGFD